MKYFAILAGEPARAEDYYIFGGVVVCGLIAFCVRVALDYAEVAKLSRSLITLAVFFPLVFACRYQRLRGVFFQTIKLGCLASGPSVTSVLPANSPLRAFFGTTRDNQPGRALFLLSLVRPSCLTAKHGMVYACLASMATVVRPRKAGICHSRRIWFE